MRFKAYVRRLLFPLYLFPIKIVTYSAYYLVKFSLKLIWYLLSWPFRKWSNFFKTVIGAVLFSYLLFSLLVIADYMRENYGGFAKFFCGFGGTRWLGKYAVRVVGGYGEGSGFFIADDQVLTNFHIIADEPSPKVIFPNGTFTTPEKILGDKNADLALIFVKEGKPEMVRTLMSPLVLHNDEPMVSVGYALGTRLKGEPTVLKGRFNAVRESKNFPVTYLQTDINLVRGMSGGPLFEKCGKVVGVNTMGLAGLSLFISSVSVDELVPTFTDKDVKKIEIDTSTPEGAVKAFYTYLKARRMEEGFNLLSEDYLQKTNFEEWTNRFKDILDVQIYGTKKEEGKKDTVFVKFSTTNWVDGEVEEHYYEGTWQTVLEDGVYKMYRSNIKEVEKPSWEWFYEI